jgi:hypothetical protein
VQIGREKHNILTFLAIPDSNASFDGRCLLVLTVFGSAFGPARKRSRLNAMFGFAKFISSRSPFVVSQGRRRARLSSRLTWRTKIRNNKNGKLVRQLH